MTLPPGMLLKPYQSSPAIIMLMDGNSALRGPTRYLELQPLLELPSSRRLLTSVPVLCIAVGPSLMSRSWNIPASHVAVPQMGLLQLGCSTGPGEAYGDVARSRKWKRADWKVID